MKFVKFEAQIMLATRPVLALYSDGTLVLESIDKSLTPDDAQALLAHLQEWRPRLTKEERLARKAERLARKAERQAARAARQEAAPVAVAAEPAPAETAPAKRGPGRPRKAQPVEAVPEPVAVEIAQPVAVPAAPVKPAYNEDKAREEFFAAVDDLAAQHAKAQPFVEDLPIHAVVDEQPSDELVQAKNLKDALVYLWERKGLRSVGELVQACEALKEKVPAIRKAAGGNVSLADRVARAADVLGFSSAA